MGWLPHVISSTLVAQWLCTTPNPPKILISWSSSNNARFARVRPVLKYHLSYNYCFTEEAIFLSIKLSINTFISRFLNLSISLSRNYYKSRALKNFWTYGLARTGSRHQASFWFAFFRWYDCDHWFHLPITHLFTFYSILLSQDLSPSLQKFSFLTQTQTVQLHLSLHLFPHLTLYELFRNRWDVRCRLWCNLRV